MRARAASRYGRRRASSCGGGRRASGSGRGGAVDQRYPINEDVLLENAEVGHAGIGPGHVGGIARCVVSVVVTGEAWRNVRVGLLGLGDEHIAGGLFGGEGEAVVLR